MRLCPAVGHFSRAIQEDFQYCEHTNHSSLSIIDVFLLGGQTIRKGSTVWIFIYGIHHDAKVFPNPEKFDPERFGDQQTNSSDISPYAYIPFSAGSRNCIGM